MKEKVLITSALPYANGPLHFGHIAGAYLPADSYARYRRLQGDDVLYICGSDEHGVAITLSAEIQGRSPQEHVDIYHEVLQNFFRQMNISFDHYSRTTWEAHRELTWQYFQDLIANGYIEDRVTEQLYSEEDNRFLADRYVVGTCPYCGFEEARGDECQQCGAAYDAVELKKPRSKITNAPLTKKETRHWFLLLDRFKEKLLGWIEQKQWKPNVVHFVKKYIEDLKPRAITRDSDWGIPVPLEGAEGKVIYVWFDAPIGYLSSTREWAQKQKDPERWKEYWCDPKTKLVQFIGKDNIPFHAMIFPAMTMGQNQPYKLVDELPANEFYNLEGRRFSKSDGWYIDLEDFFKKYDSDQIRYTIAANAPETADSEFTWRDFQKRCNAELLGKYGNFAHRVLVFLKKQGGEIPLCEEKEEIDEEFQRDCTRIVEQCNQCYTQFRLRAVTQSIMELAQRGNAYFDAKQPWKEAKGGSPQRLATTLNLCLECLKHLALVSYPIIPNAAEKLWTMLGFQKSLKDCYAPHEHETALPVGRSLPAHAVLFRKIEEEEIEAEIEKLRSMGQQAEAEKTTFEPLKEEVSIQDIQRLDLRVGQIVGAEKVKKSKKLLLLQVDIGVEQRQIVAGISSHYPAETLIGKKVVVVANLKPAKLMGVESQGMLLAASHGGQMEVTGIEALPPGSVVS